MSKQNYVARQRIQTAFREFAERKKFAFLHNTRFKNNRFEMPEFKKTNKRSSETGDKKFSSKKFKAEEQVDKPNKDGKPKFEKKKIGKFNNKPEGKFHNKSDGKFNKKPQQPLPTEKTNWGELKQKKKDLKIQRKKNKTRDLYDVDVKAKKIYEELKM